MKFTYEFLKKFCSNDNDSEGVVSKPHLFGDRTFVTNGWIALLVDGQFTRDTVEFNLSKLDFSLLGDVVELPNTEFKGVCNCCAGNKFSKRIVCDNCCSSGNLDLEDEAGNEYNVQCKSCDGDGGELKPSNATFGEVCSWCHGTGKSRFDAVVFGEQTDENSIFTISSINLELARMLDDVKISTVWSGKPGQITFSFKGGVGLIMGMRKDKDWKQL